MSNVIKFPGMTFGDLEPRAILEAALEEVDEIEELLIIRQNKDGSFQVASASADASIAVYLATKFIHKEMNDDYVKSGP